MGNRNSDGRDRARLTRYALLSLAVAIAAMAAKLAAAALTHSVGLLSDGLEQTVNVAAAVVALFALRAAARPADDTHPYGRGKAEDLSAAFEGLLIVAAALAIAAAAVPRLLHPAPLHALGAGLAVTAAAAVANLAVAVVLLRAGNRHASPALRAEGAHLRADAWTSVGVLAGVAAVWVTGWARLDPLVAVAVAGQVAWVGVRVLREAVAALCDTALPQTEHDAIDDAVVDLLPAAAQVCRVRSRRAGAHRFATLDVAVPAAWTVGQADSLATQLSHAAAVALPAGATVRVRLHTHRR